MQILFDDIFQIQLEMKFWKRYCKLVHLVCIITISLKRATL
jgi:hypothetical protein